MIVGVTSQRYDLAVLEALLSPGENNPCFKDANNHDYNTVSLDLVERIKREKPELPIVVYSMIYSSLVRDSRACFNERGAEYVPLLNSLPTDFYQNHLKKTSHLEKISNTSRIFIGKLFF